MRIILSLLALLAASPASAWQAGSDGRLCTLTHQEDSTEVLLTYDPSGPLYTITVTRSEPWPEGPIFAIGFRGGRANTIQTNRHTLSEDGRSLTVADQGFGNVLDGLSFNQIAIMGTGSALEEVSLAGAAPEVATFRDCGVVPSA